MFTGKGFIGRIFLICMINLSVFRNSMDLLHSSGKSSYPFSSSTLISSCRLCLLSALFLIKSSSWARDLKPFSRIKITVIWSYSQIVFGSPEFISLAWLCFLIVSDVDNISNTLFNSECLLVGVFWNSFFEAFFRIILSDSLSSCKSEGRAEALQTVMMQRELWADNEDFDRGKDSIRYDVKSTRNKNIKLVAEEQINYK